MNAMSSIDNRTDVEEGKVKCLEYDSNSKIFTLTCSFEWKETFGDNSDGAFISLQAGEKFVGNDDYIIDLTGITAFEGMFSVSASYEDDPQARNARYSISTRQAPSVNSNRC